MLFRSEAAVREAERQLPDLILMDLQMPGLDGLEATRMIRRTSGPLARVRIVALSADAIGPAREQALQAGMDDFLPKPFRWEQLAALLERHSALPARETAAAVPAPAAPAAPAADTPAVAPGEDATLIAMREITQLLGPATYGPLLRDFLDETTGSQVLLRQALLQGDAAALAYQAHQYKGAAHLLGLAALADAAAAIEQETAPIDPSRAQWHLQRIQEGCRAAHHCGRSLGLLGSGAAPR